MKIDVYNDLKTKIKTDCKMTHEQIQREKNRQKMSKTIRFNRIYKQNESKGGAKS